MKSGSKAYRVALRRLDDTDRESLPEQDRAVLAAPPTAACLRSADLQRTLERTGRPVRGPMAELVEEIPEFVSAAG